MGQSFFFKNQTKYLWFYKHNQLVTNSDLLSDLWFQNQVELVNLEVLENEKQIQKEKTIYEKDKL